MIRSIINAKSQPKVGSILNNPNSPGSTIVVGPNPLEEFCNIIFKVVSCLPASNDLQSKMQQLGSFVRDWCPQWPAQGSTESERSSNNRLSRIDQPRISRSKLKSNKRTTTVPFPSRDSRIDRRRLQGRWSIIDDDSILLMVTRVSCTMKMKTNHGIIVFQRPRLYHESTFQRRERRENGWSLRLARPFKSSISDRVIGSSVLHQWSWFRYQGVYDIYVGVDKRYRSWLTGWSNTHSSNTLDRPVSRRRERSTELK